MNEFERWWSIRFEEGFNGCDTFPEEYARAGWEAGWAAAKIEALVEQELDKHDSGPHSNKGS